MFPNQTSIDKDVKNPFCEKNLIYVKFVKFHQAHLRQEKRCTDYPDKAYDEMRLKEKNATGLQAVTQYVVIYVSSNNLTLSH